MPERMELSEFFKQCGNVVHGYTLYEGQVHPETYGELTNFIIDRLHIEKKGLSLSGLSEWLLNNRENPDSCSPDIDTEHVTTVLLIGELEDPDAYVASLPSPEESVVLPPSWLVRQLIATQH